MKKFRGQHRYYRRLKVGTPAVHRKMDEWIHYLKNGQSQYDYDHIHFDVTILFSALTRMFPKPTFAP